MKYAYSTLACPRWTIEQIVDAALRYGYDAIELRLLDGSVIDPVADRAKLMQAVAYCRTRGSEVCALGTSSTFNHADPRERERQREALLRWIEVAHNLNVPLLRVFGGRGDGSGSEEEQNAWVAEALRRAASEAAHAGITVMLETHDAFCSARRVATVLDAVGASHVAALWDSHHPYQAGESAGEVVALLGARIAHVHVKDARRGTPDWQLVPLGEGEVPVAEQLAALARMGYNGYVSVEWEKKWHPELDEPEIALPQHIAWLRTHAPA